jgi:hypothetical protein
MDYDYPVRSGICVEEQVLEAGADFFVDGGRIWRIKDLRTFIYIRNIPFSTARFGWIGCSSGARN